MLSLARRLRSPVLALVLAMLATVLLGPRGATAQEGHHEPAGQKHDAGEPPRGPWDNTFEVLLTFVRDQIAKPNIGEDKADRYVPFLWTLFLFILFNNLLGMFPFLGAATSSIYVTGALALIVFFAIHG